MTSKMEARRRRMENVVTLRRLAERPNGPIAAFVPKGGCALQLDLVHLVRAGVTAMSEADLDPGKRRLERDVVSPRFESGVDAGS
ncbi:hypothetical protein [Amycolatopsis plumensis]|uniref:Uncharacterized protein n=1 Tax=Amycolatopsis plumensis TaxID=236508 RepID=A0ABV5U5Z9_9PSEU